ncbi:hypothetical protein DFH11DRAFT_1727843 [Phellopilus nigrolimitatus]|nr:hypothetical protein DFH11DRAFT_1727843 [Phellopilus nigrolimitatus]
MRFLMLAALPPSPFPLAASSADPPVIGRATGPPVRRRLTDWLAGCHESPRALAPCFWAAAPAGAPGHKGGARLLRSRQLLCYTLLQADPAIMAPEYRPPEIATRSTATNLQYSAGPPPLLSTASSNRRRLRQPHTHTQGGIRRDSSQTIILSEAPSSTLAWSRRRRPGRLREQCLDEDPPYGPSFSTNLV